MKEVTSLLRQHPFTAGFWPEQVDLLASMAGRAHFGSGELIFHEGDQSSLFYLIVSGNVALEVKSPGRPLRVATLYPGEVLGWSSLTGNTGKQFQARALEPVETLSFDGVRLAHACESDYAFGFALMRAILSVMADRLQAIRAQLIESSCPVGKP